MQQYKIVCIVKKSLKYNNDTWNIRLFTISSKYKCTIQKRLNLLQYIVYYTLQNLLFKVLSWNPVIFVIINFLFHPYVQKKAGCLDLYSCPVNLDICPWKVLLFFWILPIMRNLFYYKSLPCNINTKQFSTLD